MLGNQSSPQLIKIEQKLKLAKLEEIMDKISLESFISEENGIIAFLGPTKSGKSTLINCLMGNPMICIKDRYTEETSIICEKSELGPAIGVRGESTTLVPQRYLYFPDTPLPMWDFPGFGDNKGTEQEVANAVAYTNILKQQNSVRFVLVVPIDIIKSDNPLQFYKILDEMGVMCPNFPESLCIIVTKSEKGTASAWLNSAFNTQFPNANKENSTIYSNGKVILKEILKRKNFIDFKAPVILGDCYEDKFMPPNLDDIIALIGNIRGTWVSDFPLAISDQAKNEIEKLYTMFNQKLMKKIEKFSCYFNEYVGRNIQDIIQAKDNEGNPLSSSARLALFKQGKDKINSILENADNFDSFFIEVKKYGFQVENLLSTLKKFQLILKFKHMNMPKDKPHVQEKLDYINKIRLELISLALKYSDLIKNSEVASAEEKKREIEWKAEKEKENEYLRKEIVKLEYDNSFPWVKATKAIGWFLGFMGPKNKQQNGCDPGLEFHGEQKVDKGEIPRSVEIIEDFQNKKNNTES